MSGPLRPPSRLQSRNFFQENHFSLQTPFPSASHPGLSTPAESSRIRTTPTAPSMLFPENFTSTPGINWKPMDYGMHFSRKLRGIADTSGRQGPQSTHKGLRTNILHNNQRNGTSTRLRTRSPNRPGIPGPPRRPTTRYRPKL